MVIYGAFPDKSGGEFYVRLDLIEAYLIEAYYPEAYSPEQGGGGQRVRLVLLMGSGAYLQTGVTEAAGTDEAKMLAARMSMQTAKRINEAVAEAQRRAQAAQRGPSILVPGVG